ncbi:hypothetical protein Moror_12382 [Moniliophthora roreri MCA 2997]|uniref:Uncharacterized protein n=1 Tax=Moniliophthora roreri (strain MCA 2997) TaxID=1381753 RepID=V2YW14_MONRO|nr:hypothetical protein Moror_12382 [Moniliophthora roreri MCA 2997]
MSQSFTYNNLQPTAAQLLFLLNNTHYKSRIIDAARSNLLVDHLVTNYQFHQEQHHHFESLLTGVNYRMNLIASDITVTGFVIPGQITVPMICAPNIFSPHLPPVTDSSTDARDETSPFGRLEYPPRCLSESLEDYKLVKSSRPTSAPPVAIIPNPDHPPTPPPIDIPPCPSTPSLKHNNSESSSALTSRRSPSQPELNSTEPLPHPLVSLTQSLQTTTLSPHGLPETGSPQMTNRTHPPGLSAPRPPNSLNENNDTTKTTSPESPRSSSPTNVVSMTDFLDVINAANQVTIHRTVELASAQSATHTALIISLNIAHNYNAVNEFLLLALPTTIATLMDLRRTTVMPPLSVTSPMSPTSTDEESEQPLTVTIRITDDREPVTITTPDREERTFVPVRFINGAVVYEAGTSDINRG